MEPVDTVKWVNDVLLNYEMQSENSQDSALVIIRKSPKKEYKRALVRFTDMIIKEQTDSKRLNYDLFNYFMELLVQSIIRLCQKVFVMLMMKMKIRCMHH